MATIKPPEQISREVIDAHYGIGTEWEEPNQFGEEGFTRAQAESDIEADDIRLLIEQAINTDRAQWFDTVSSASRQHFIDTGRYLLHDGTSDLDEVECGHNDQTLTDEGLVHCEDCKCTFIPDPTEVARPRPTPSGDGMHAESE